MQTHRLLNSLLTAASLTAFLWHVPANADTLGVYQPPVLRKAEAALQHGHADHALALLRDRGAEMRRWGAEAQADDVMCRAWFQKGDYARAEHSCDAAVLAGGESSWNYVYHRGVMRLLTGDIEEGVADLHKVSTMSHDSAAVPAELAVVERF